MSPRRSAPTSSAKRVPYRAPRPRREVGTAIIVGVLIVVVTASLVWFLRPNRESTSTPPVDTSTAVTTTPSSTDTAATTTAPTGDTTAPTDTTVAGSGG